jgi:hypothetical protein
MGDSSFDKNGIGKMDDSKHQHDSDNKWRFQHMGNHWWYWMPGGYWNYYSDGNWCQYNQDTYVDDSPPVQAGNGPLYEDQDGFYYLNGDQKVYDQSIHRDSGTPAPDGGQNAPNGG